MFCFAQACVDFNDGCKSGRPREETVMIRISTKTTPLAHRSIDFIGYERLGHVPFSPDLAPMDICIFSLSEI